jgi:ankyrin repeat protein
MIEKDPTCLKLTNRGGNYPLHVACHTNSDTILISMYRRLIESSPSATAYPDYDGNYPIHLACKRKRLVSIKSK